MQEALSYHAVKNGHKDVVRMLLASGADAGRCRDAIVRAEERGHVGIVTLLKASLREREPLRAFWGLASASWQGSLLVLVYNKDVYKRGWVGCVYNRGKVGTTMVRDKNKWNGPLGSE